MIRAVPPQHTTPCGSCPFLIKNAGMIRGGRAQEIANGLEHDCHFWCHKTVNYGARRRVDARSRLCAGSLIVAERSKARPTQLAQVYERLGFLDWNAIAGSTARCFRSLRAFVQGHTKHEASFRPDADHG